MPKTGRSESLPEISKAEMEHCLERIMSSQVFSGADRMQEFLRYVVGESIEGRAGNIKGKTIALDVYSRSATSDGDPENVVRVEARRLRRRLSDYYEAEGRDDRVRIHIDSGGYIPRFELNSTSASDTDTETEAPAKRPKWITLVAVVAGAAFVLLGLYVWSNSIGPTRVEVANQKKLERQALLEKSPTALQAVNLAEQARRMVFPLFDVERQKLAHSIFEQAIRLDPEYFGGYAGSAQSLGTLAVLTQDPVQKATYLEQASERVEKAINLNPTHSWTQASSAWVAFARGDNERALELSRRAYALGPDDWYVSDIHGLVALFSGNFIEARNVSDPSRATTVSSWRSGSRNIYAAANFHLGAFRKTLTSFDEIGELGGPIGPPRLAYQAAAKHALGDLDAARTLASELKGTWPGFRVDYVLFSFFENPVYAEDVMKRLEISGWTAEK